MVNRTTLINKELAFILGGLCGDASILRDFRRGRSMPNRIRLVSKDQEYCLFFNKCLESMLGKSFIFQDKRGFYYSGINSVSFSNHIVSIYGDFSQKGWRVPKGILTSNNHEVISYFLRSFFDSDACARKYDIRIQNINKDGLLDISFLLGKLGIENRISEEKRRTSKGNRVFNLSITSSRQMAKYRDLIGFTIKRKQEKLLDLPKPRK